MTARIYPESTLVGPALTPRCVLYNFEHHPSSAPHLLPLLESTTRRFVDDARFQQDIRYLKLWVQYARQVDRREDVWAYLESRDIGTRHAVFYEEWAGALEALNRWVHTESACCVEARAGA
jgi:checkpoint serine/threonine-protein kinase